MLGVALCSFTNKSESEQKAQVWESFIFLLKALKMYRL